MAPQFDAVDTLEGSGAVMRQLLGGHVYRRHLDSRGRLQTVLIGYSASNRKAGMLAARVAAYRAQRTLSAALRAGARRARAVLQPWRQYCRAAVAASMRCCALHRPSP